MFPVVALRPIRGCSSGQACLTHRQSAAQQHWSFAAVWTSSPCGAHPVSSLYSLVLIAPTLAF